MQDIHSLNWKDAIAYMQKRQERLPEDPYTQLLWKKLQLGHRTQDILMDIDAFISLDRDGASSSPEWQAATKWLAYQRAQSSNLLLDMLWTQLETGDRTTELLQLIRNAANPQTSPAPPAPSQVVVIPDPMPVDNTPPSTDF